MARGVETLTEFFGTELGRRMAEERGPADLVLGNNVLAQVPDINDFVAGVAALLAPAGTATFEFPHLAKLIEHLEYDTIYHEHFSYFSLHSIQSIFGAQGLALVDVEELPSHGGSLRVFLQHADAGVEPSAAVADVLTREDEQGMRDPATYARFAEGRARVEARAPRAADRAPPRGQARRRLRRTGQGQHAPQLLRHPDGLPRLHGRPEPVQAGQAHAGDAHPDPPARADRGDAGRT